MRPSKIRIVLVDDDISFLKNLCKFLSGKNGFEVVGTAANGLEAVDIITQSKPDIVILDLVMPYLDGLGVLEKLRWLHINRITQFIVVSPVGNLKTVQMAIALGAEYFIMKPFDFEEFAIRIRQLQSQKHQKSNQVARRIQKSEAESSVEDQVKKILDHIGVPAHLKGYHYLIRAISLVLEDLSFINSMGKNIYEKIAQEFKTTPANAERAIRNAIEITWNSGDVDSLFGLFECEVNDRKTKPSNSEFIMTVVNQYLNAL